MAERICPEMTRPDKLVRCHDGYPDQPHYTFPAGLQCQLWDNGDCGLKVAREDKSKEMWERLKKWTRSIETMRRFGILRQDVLAEMNKIEAEMGGKDRKT